MRFGHNGVGLDGCKVSLCKMSPVMAGMLRGRGCVIKVSSTVSSVSDLQLSCSRHLAISSAESATPEKMSLSSLH